MTYGWQSEFTDGSKDRNRISAKATVLLSVVLRDTAVYFLETQHRGNEIFFPDNWIHAPEVL